MSTTTHPPQASLISAPELQTLLKQPTHRIMVVDCRFDLANPQAGRSSFEKGHIPGAVYAHLDEVLSGPKTGTNGRHPLPDPPVFGEWMNQVGILPTTHVIAMDAQGGMFAARLWWLLRWMGHTQVSLLDGGWQQWHGPQESGPGMRLVTSVAHERTAGHMPTLGVQAVLNNLEQPRFVLMDARAPDRFAGQNETMDPVGGHIPGALNHFFKNNLTEQGCFKPPVELKAQFEAVLQAAGASDTTVVHQCGSGVTACHNVFAMALAGLGVAPLYAGSWSEYCSDSTRPMA